MIRPADRRLAAFLVRIGVWRVGRSLFGVVRLVPSKRTRWLWEWMRSRQAREDRPYHHAPGCPANRWAEAELVIGPCRCGAVARDIVSRSYR